MGKLSPLEREVQERVVNMCPHDSRYTEERLLKYSLTGILSRLSVRRLRREKYKAYGGWGERKSKCV